MRVALIIPTLDQSGAEKQFALLAAGLPQNEFDVLPIALTRGGPYAAKLEAAGRPPVIIGKQWKVDPLAWWKLRRELLRFQPQVLHTWLFAGNAYGRLAIGALPQTRVLVSERCVDQWKSGWQKWVDRQLISRTDCLVGNSQSVIEFYQKLGVPAALCRVIPNAINQPVKSTLDRSQMLAELGFPPEAYVAVFVGRLAPQKRVRDLIWATETLRQIRPQLRFVVVGEGPLRTELETFAEKTGCANHVRFVGHQSNVQPWLELADVFWNASEFEGQSNSLMEAMALAKPVVVSNIPANCELVTSGTTGLIAKMGDSVGFMQFTRELIDQPELGQRLGEAARNEMETRHGVKSMIEAYSRLYRELCGKNL